jgi:hypothetical protein
LAHLHVCMEWRVKHIGSVASDGKPTALGNVVEPVSECHTPYTPRDFFKQFGAVIAICLGLALLAQVLVIMVVES